MAIPKIIHYCWFGGNPFSKMEKECIESWKKFCPDYEIMRWDESNVDLYKYGGIYLDTDVKLIKSLDDLLELKAYAGIEDPWTVNTGLGFGSEKKQSDSERIYQRLFNYELFG